METNISLIKQGDETFHTPKNGQPFKKTCLGFVVYVNYNNPDGNVIDVILDKRGKYSFNGKFKIHDSYKYASKFVEYYQKEYGTKLHIRPYFSHKYLKQ